MVDSNNFRLQSFVFKVLFKMKYFRLTLITISLISIFYLVYRINTHTIQLKKLDLPDKFETIDRNDTLIINETNGIIYLKFYNGQPLKSNEELILTQ